MALLRDSTQNTAASYKATRAKGSTAVTLRLSQAERVESGTSEEKRPGSQASLFLLHPTLRVCRNQTEKLTTRADQVLQAQYSALEKHLELKEAPGIAGGHSTVTPPFPGHRVHAGVPAGSSHVRRGLTGRWMPEQQSCPTCSRPPAQGTSSCMEDSSPTQHAATPDLTQHVNMTQQRRPSMERV